MSFISIIIPVYNVEAYLEECVESVLAQTFKDVEILLIDDGSTDTSGYLCEDIALTDSRIKVFHKLNGGLSSARNYGMIELRVNISYSLVRMIIGRRVMLYFYWLKKWRRKI